MLNPIRFTLRKEDKIVLKAEFDLVRNAGKKYVGPTLVAVVCPDERVRCGVVCGKKYSLLAVKRNRARRLLWESFRLLKPYLQPCRIVLIPRKGLMSAKCQNTQKELAKLLTKAGVLHQETVISQSVE